MLYRRLVFWINQFEFFSSYKHTNESLAKLRPQSVCITSLGLVLIHFQVFINFFGSWAQLVHFPGCFIDRKDWKNYFRKLNKFEFVDCNKPSEGSHERKKCSKVLQSQKEFNGILWDPCRALEIHMNWKIILDQVRTRHNDLLIRIIPKTIRRKGFCMGTYKQIWVELL